MNQAQIIAILTIVALVGTFVVVADINRTNRLQAATDKAFQALSAAEEGGSESVFVAFAEAAEANQAILSYSRSEAASVQQCDALKQQMLTVARSRNRQAFATAARQWAQARCFQYLSRRGSAVQRGGRGGGSGPTCNLVWDPPKLSDGKGLRKIGEFSNVQVSLSGFTANSSVYLRNNGPTTVRGSVLPIGQNGSYSYKDVTQISSSEYRSGFYNTWVMDERTQKALTSCDFGFKIEGAANEQGGSAVQRSGGGAATTPTCNMAWDAPRLIDGKGLRKIGQNSNVNVRLSGFSGGAGVRLQNNGPTTIRGPLLTLDAGGNYSYYDSTQIKDAEYDPGFYNTWVMDERTQTALTSCDFGFKIESAAT